MQLKKIKPKESSIRYNPKINELTFVSELKFSFNKEKEEFQLDQNPNGEPSLVIIDEIRTEDNFEKLIIQANYRNKNTEFTLNSDKYYDRIIYETLVDFNKDNFNITSDEDKIEMIFTSGNISKIYCYKYEGYNLKESLSIISEDNKLFLIKQNPWSKNEILSLEINQNQIICTLKSETYKYVLEVQPFIKDLIKKLINKG
ncbi:hypothetical protein [Aquimarina sp. MMG016]|uniref:hypothetical protein n=1 Tax=Aquimarina sp. MMG016 TaxID=2822690 RepID=UPI001B3A6447|nr:hypothetical protein [Aquimarina sp. MMG016]MBQ4818696.1 hypothetical protein [Aquimarina sp. MMG016]